MKSLFDKISYRSSEVITKVYSTSFSLGIVLLSSSIRPSIYGIYGFVRAADEIVDSFEGYDQKTLLADMKEDTFKAIKKGISVNPILNSFQHVVNNFQIPLDYIESFFKSMERDLYPEVFTKESYDEYIYGSAEVVGLMCLKVFCKDKEALFSELVEPAKKLGSAFQKVNFLRDVQQDNNELGRMYFPNISFHHFTESDKKQIELEIEEEFHEAFNGIKKLPLNCRSGIYLAYHYYRELLKKIKGTSAEKITKTRIRVNDYKKLSMYANTVIKHQFGIL